MEVTTAKTAVQNAMNAMNGLPRPISPMVYAKPVPPKEIKKMTSLISLKQLEKRCRQTVDQVMAAGTVHQNKQGKKFSFLDRGSKILAVAHCDWVSSMPLHFSKCSIPYETLIYSPQLDDRLGVYTILDLLPSLGINVDVLLTDDEERGASTASMFDTDKEYNWIVEFDRRGTGAVMYEYDFPCKEWFTVHNGTYSDISMLGHLGVQGVNIGVGYYDEHTTRCHMVLEDYAEQMCRFKAMHKALKNARLPYVKPSWNSKWDAEEDDGWWQCDGCGQWFFDREIDSEVVDGYTVCIDCYDEAFNQDGIDDHL